MWADDLIEAWHDALAVIAPDANHLLTFRELSHLTRDDKQFLGIHHCLNGTNSKTARRVATYLLCKALAKRIVACNRRPRHLFLDKFNPFIFCMSRIALFSNVLPTLTVMPAPSKPQKQRSLIDYMREWDVASDNIKHPDSSSILLTDWPYEEDLNVRNIWPDCHISTTSYQRVISFFNNHGDDNWLTIIIPTLSTTRARFVLKSIRAQNVSGVKVLVVSKAGSSHESSQCEDQETVFPSSKPRISFLSHLDLGVYDAMNLGTAMCDTPWIYFIGDDDQLADAGVLPAIKNAIHDCDPLNSIIYGNVKILGDGHGTYDGQLYGYLFDYFRLKLQNPCQQAIFYKTQFLRDHGGFNTKYPICADWDLNLRAWQNANPKFIDLVIAVFKRGGLSSARHDALFFEHLPDIWAAHQHA
ncbi:hypothetical protein N9U42_02705 [Luminiphilus sp.]|nr:hypothetical protein [Luminiphilus sp.]MDA9711257.1 hypothetical protein [Luminiphilus sp.]